MSNELIISSYRMSLGEKRILMCVLAQIGIDDQPTDNQLYTLSLKEYQQATGLNRSAAWEELREGADRLIEKVIRINADGERYKRTIIVQECDYDPNQGVVLRFGRAILPFISQLKTEFTRYRLMDAVSFGSVYTIRIYEMLMRFQSVGCCVLMVDDLREQLELGDKYTNGKDFRVNIIERPVKEINKKGVWYVRYTPEKLGRRIIGYQFTFEKVKTIEHEKPKSKNSRKPQKIPVSFIKKYNHLVSQSVKTYEEAQNHPSKRLQEAWDQCTDWLSYVGC